MFEIEYETGGAVDPGELAEFYGRMQHEINADPQKLSGMIHKSAVFVAARHEGRLIGVSRGVCDGLRGFFAECKLDPVYQGPAAITRKDGRIEHDSYGIAAEMARRVIEKFQDEGIERVDVLAWGTEVDFLEELGFKRSGGLVGLTMRAGRRAAAPQNAGTVTS